MAKSIGKLSDHYTNRFYNFQDFEIINISATEIPSKSSISIYTVVVANFWSLDRVEILKDDKISMLSKNN